MARARILIGAGALAAATVLGLAAFVVAGSSPDDGDLSSPPAIASVAPSTIEVRIPPGPVTPGPAATSAPAAGPPASSTTTTTTTTTMAPMSPLATLVGEPVSVLPPPAVALPAPTRIAIEAIGVDVPIRPVGVAPDGQLEIPDETEVGWYRLGSSPGEAGASVLAGHVSWNRTSGPFVRLGELQPGTRVAVALDDGSTRSYEVVERAQYGKLELPAERIWVRDGPETLVLITCGGAFNPDIRRYRDNIVVYAVPVA